MVKEDILNMKLGRELDILIAEKVMEWNLEYGFNSYIKEWYKNGYYLGETEDTFKPSLNISSAWKVFEYIKSLNAWIEIAWNPKKKHYRCMIGANNTDEKLNSVDIVGFKTMQEAICKVALISKLNLV